MNRFPKIFNKYFLNKTNLLRFNSSSSSKTVPTTADVVVIGGGSAGCHVLYHLAKRGIKCVLLERSKLTAGTTWHTAGLIWRLRPNDVDIQLLANSRNMLLNLESETGQDPGFIQNGGLFIAHSDVRLDEYKRLASIGNSLQIENHVLNPEETQKVFPLLDPKSLIGSLYSPGDGVIDPAMLCAALTKSATNNGAAVIENCPVDDLIIENGPQFKKITGVKTPFGNIKTNVVVNATGVWGKDLIEKHGTKLPLVPMKHAYIVSESIKGVRGLPNVRDHDYSIYFRIQGESICMGGYEDNPILLDHIPTDFNFGLYDLDWSVFDTHIKGAVNICPAFGTHGIKSTVCGPESFTPDHKPLMGPDPNVQGIYHHCGFNSAGMMFGGGCGEQTALWIINGQPDLPMFHFDLHRFTDKQCANVNWVKEKSHESYVKNYSMVFPHDQPLGHRNFKLDPLHDDMMSYNAFMEEKQGWERPGFFLKDKEDPKVLPYDWYGSYEFKRNLDSMYEKCLDGDLKYQFSDYHDLIGSEANSCRNNAVLFNLSYFAKMYLTGPEAKQAADWIFTANTNREYNKTVYTCLLNKAGGVEGDVTVSKIKPGTGNVHDPNFNSDTGYYIVAGGASAYYTYNNILKEIKKKKFKVDLKDVTEEMGVISIQGPNSRTILQKIIDFNLSDSELAFNSTNLANVLLDGKKLNVRILRISFVGELGYELHIPKENCSEIYKLLMKMGKPEGLSNAGYRALYSLSSEKGYHLWGYDLRSNDTPIEANLGFVCRKKGSYKGKEIIESQKQNGINKRLAYFSLDEQIPVWGLEGVYRNGSPCGFLRRGEYAYTLGKSFGQAYIERKDGLPIDAEYIKSGEYEIDVLGKLYKAKCHIKSPFDPDHKRLHGIYK